ncbi:MAG TPA: porin [Usitatibacteraceae bacterium]
MNKKLIALAVAAATLAPAVVMAQTANPVTLYGRLYGTFESVETSHGLGGVNKPRTNRVNDNSSYLGVKGVEDLGGGLNAWFQIESNAPVDAGGGTLAGRNSAVGLQGGFGTVFLGRWDTPLKTATVAIDVWGDLTIAGIQAVMNDQSNFHLRANNTAGYWSPVVNGFQAKFHYLAPESRTTGAGAVNPLVYSMSGTYTGGPFYAGYAYEQHKDRTGTEPPVTATTCLGATCAGYTEKEHAVFGSVVVGPFKFGAIYEQITKTSAVVVNIPKQKAFMLNGTYNVGKGAFVAQYMQAKDAIAQVVNNPTHNKIQNYSVGYQYNFTKRTQANVLYTQTFNNYGANGNFGANKVAGLTSGQDVKGVSFGIRHLF